MNKNEKIMQEIEGREEENMKKCWLFIFDVFFQLIANKVSHKSWIHFTNCIWSSSISFP